MLPGLFWKPCHDLPSPHLLQTLQTTGIGWLGAPGLCIRDEWGWAGGLFSTWRVPTVWWSGSSLVTEQRVGLHVNPAQWSRKHLTKQGGPRGCPRGVTTQVPMLDLQYLSQSEALPWLSRIFSLCLFSIWLHFIHLDRSAYLVLTIL